MSKSKKNVVDPDDIIAAYGADTARWFMLSDTPPERDIEWTSSGVEGAIVSLQRIWRLVHEAAAKGPRAAGERRTRTLTRKRWPLGVRRIRPLPRSRCHREAPLQ